MKILTSLIAILVVASSLAYWLFRRRARDRARKLSVEHAPFSDNLIADKSRTTMFQVEPAGDRPLTSQQEVPTVEDPTKKREANDVGGVEPSAVQHMLPKHDNSTYPEAEVPVADDDIVEPTQVAESADPLLSAELSQSISIPQSKSFQKEDKTAGLLELPHLKGAGLAQETTANEISRTAVSDQDRQAERLMPERAETTPRSYEEEPLQTGDGSGDVELCAPAEEPSECETQKTPLRYRSPQQRPPRQITTRSSDRQARAVAPSEVVLDVRVRLTLDRFGFCAVTFLPERTAELDDEIAVKQGTTSLGLIAQEDWYQDLSFSDTSKYLRDGFEMKGILSDQRRARWLLKGRDLYVLAAHPRASGFISTSRLVLGRSDIVLCATTLADEVEAVLKEAGCEGYSRLDEALGVPSDWVGFRGVSPMKAIALDLGTNDPLYAIKPATDIEIEFVGGIWLRNSVWLAGYPPQIKLFGPKNPGMKVLIDGREAQFTSEGSVFVDGYDLPGQHYVYCEGLSRSRSYSIEEAPDSWEAWPAYQFGQAAICGPSVQLPPENQGRRAFTVPMSNPLLIGAEPGQVFRCSTRSFAIWKGFVPFDVVWALPAHPLICNKKTARILQVADVSPFPGRAGTKPFAWCSAILDASRKGLRIEGGSAESTARWREYKKTARNIWRARP